MAVGAAPASHIPTDEELLAGTPFENMPDDMPEIAQTADTPLASESQYDGEPKEKLPPLLHWWHDTTQRWPTPKDRSISNRLMKRADWDDDIALAAAKLNYRQATENGTAPSGLAYFEPAIIMALESGQMPGQKKTKATERVRW